MPKLRVDPIEKAKTDFLREIKIKRAQYDILQRDIGAEINLSVSATSSLLSRPDDISVGRLRKIIAMLRLDPVIVMALLGYSVKDLKKGFADEGGA